MSRPKLDSSRQARRTRAQLAHARLRRGDPWGNWEIVKRAVVREVINESEARPSWLR